MDQSRAHARWLELIQIGEASVLPREEARAAIAHGRAQEVSRRSHAGQKIGMFSGLPHVPSLVAKQIAEVSEKGTTRLSGGVLFWCETMSPTILLLTLARCPSFA